MQVEQIEFSNLAVVGVRTMKDTKITEVPFMGNREDKVTALLG